MTTSFQLLGDYQSQPSRAIFALATINADKMKYPWEIKEVSMGQMEQYTPEFKKVNPIGKVPAMRVIRGASQPDFNLFESHAIMKYICFKNELPQHWYPYAAQTDEEIKLRAGVDMYLDWHHGGIRMGAGGFMFRKYFSALMDKNGKGDSEYSVQEAWTILVKSLKYIERIWLPRNSSKRFMFGDKPSIADLALACELGNLNAIDHLWPLKEKHPSIWKWLHQDMMSIAGFAQIHNIGTPRVKVIIDNLAQRLKDEQEEEENEQNEKEIEKKAKM